MIHGLLISIVDFIGFLIFWLIGWFSFKAFKLTKLKILMFFLIGFIILGIGDFFHGFALLIVIAHHQARKLMYLSVLLAEILDTVAYTLIAIGYSTKLEDLFKKIPIILPVLFPFLQIVNISLLLYICFFAFLNYYYNKKDTTLYTFFGFLSLLLSHLSIFFFGKGIEIIVTRSLYFIGSLLFLAMLLKVIKVDERKKIKA